jgi:hypothetical protein
VRYEDITRAPGPVSEDHDALALEVGDEAPSRRAIGSSGEALPSPSEPHDHGHEEHGHHDASDFDEDLSGVKLSDLALEDRPERRDVSGRVVVPRVPKRPETVDPSIFEPRFTPEGIAFPYPTTKMFRGFGPCRGRRHHHEGIDLGGVGPDWGIGTPIRSMAKAEVTFIGLGDDNPDDFGLPDKRKGEALRGDRMLPRSRFIEPYGDVFFFTRKKGRWRSGNIVVTRAVDGPLEGHVIRYLHLGGVHPDIEVGTILEAGEELGVMGGTGVQESAPHLHLDITAPNGRRVDVAPMLGLPPTATCKVSDEPTKEARTTSRKAEERSRLTDKEGEDDGTSPRRESKRTGNEGDEPKMRDTSLDAGEDDVAKAKDEKAKAKEDDKTRVKDEKAKAKEDDKTQAKDEKAKAKEDDKTRVKDEKAKAKDDDKARAKDEKLKAKDDDKTRAKDEKAKAKDDDKTQAKDDDKTQAKDDKAKTKDEKVRAKDDEKAKTKDEKVRAKDDEKVRAKDDEKAKAKDDLEGDGKSKEDETERRSTMRAGMLKLSKCKTTKRAEDFGSGRHDAHAVSVELDAGQVLTVELMRGGGTWKPRLEIIGDGVDAKSLASGKIGGKAVSSIRAKSAGKVQLVISGWDRGRPPKDASYTLKVAEKCRR